MRSKENLLSFIQSGKVLCWKTVSQIESTLWEERGERTMRSSTGAAISVVTKLVNMHATLQERSAVLPLDIQDRFIF